MTVDFKNQHLRLEGNSHRMVKGQGKSLLECFTGDYRGPDGLQKLQKRFKTTDPRKSNQMVSTAIQNYSGKNGLDPMKRDGISSARNDQMNTLVDELRKILSFEEGPRGTVKAGMLREAVKDWSEDTNPDIKDGLIVKCEKWEEDYQAYFAVRALCLVDPKTAFVHTGRESSPFEEAAERGATELVHVMLEELLASLEKAPMESEEPKVTVYKKYLSRPSGKGGMSAFHLAAQNVRLGVIKRLLQDFPRLADKESLSAVIRKTAPSQTKDDRETAFNAFKHIVELMEDKMWPIIWNEAIEVSSIELIRYLLRDTEPGKRGEFVTDQYAMLLMKSGSKDMWNEFSFADRKKLVGDCNDQKGLLHAAVESHNAELVDEIIKEFPGQIETRVKKGPRDDTELHKHSNGFLRQDENRTQKSAEDNTKVLYPIQFLTGPEQPTYKRIRDTLLHAMIRSSSENLGIRQIRAILKHSKVEADTICLHLSNIDTEEQSFAEYVHWLQSQDETIGSVFKFENILKYARFPDLHTQMPRHSDDLAANLRQDHDEIKIVIDWLKKRKSPATQILELSVPDRLFSPHSDDIVSDCVNGLGVRTLNWRKLDLYLVDLKERDDLEELHLYSSGNKSVHKQWYKELPSFKKLQRLYVNVVVDVLSKERAQKALFELQNNLDSINRSNAEVAGRWTNGHRHGLETESLPVNGILKSFRKVPVREYHWETSTGHKTYRELTDITNDVVGPNLAAFLRKYTSYKQNQAGFVKTKVAIIDSGVVIAGGRARAHGVESEEKFESESELDLKPSSKVNPMILAKEKRYTNDLARHVVDGTSLVDTGDDEEQVWWHASEPHGTQMARLICSMDSRCELYAIKVAETRSSGISANVVAEAIEWAISRSVDVISLSLVAYTDTDKMSDAIMKAREHDIVVITSTADQGVIERPTTSSKATHVNNKDMFTIAACNRWGHLLDPSAKAGFEFSFIGHDVHVGQVPFLKSAKFISGSSVATAIAAGIASLIIACCRISKNCRKDGNHPWRMRMVRDTFTYMQEKGSQYVALENLCGKNVTIENLDFEEMVDHTFPRSVNQG